MRVLITRSEPGASRMADELAAAGLQPVVVPLLSAQPTMEAFPAERYEHVIFVSEHAVLHAKAAFPGGNAGLGSIAPEARWYAIGPATDAALRVALSANTAAGAEIAITVPEPARSEGLLAIDCLQNIAGDRVLIVAGVAGRALLADTLQARGATVCSWLVYRRVELHPEPATLAGTVSTEGPVELLVASSGQGLELLTRQWLAAGGGLDVPVCVPSPRVFELATKLGWLKPVNCPGASASAAIAGLSQHGLWPA